MTPQDARAAVNVLATQLRNEWKTTAKVMAAVPNDRRDYKPDDKARSAWELVTHLAAIDLWFLDSVVKGAFGAPGETPAWSTTSDVADWYSTAFPAKLDEVLALPDQKLADVVDFYGMQKPAVEYVTFCLAHMAHHRGQLATYLRPMGGKVPSIYGGSADESFQP